MNLLKKIVLIGLLGAIAVIVLFHGGRPLLIAYLESCTRTFPYTNSSSDINLENKLIYKGGVSSICISNLDGKKAKLLFDEDFGNIGHDKTFLGLNYETEKIYYSDRGKTDYSVNPFTSTYTVFEKDLRDNSEEKVFSFTPNYSHFVTDGILMSDDSKMSAYTDQGEVKIISFEDQVERLLIDNGCSNTKTAPCYQYRVLSWSPDKKTLILSKYFSSDDQDLLKNKTVFLKVNLLAQNITSSVVPLDIKNIRWLPDSRSFITWTGSKLVLFDVNTERVTDLTQTDWGNFTKIDSSYFNPVQIQSISPSGEKAIILITRGIDIKDDNGTPAQVEVEIFVLDLKNNTSRSIGKRVDNIQRDWFDGEVQNPIIIKTIWAPDNRSLFVSGLKGGITEILDTVTMQSKPTNLSVSSFIGFTQ